jgi:hypothetical protein
VSARLYEASSVEKSTIMCLSLPPNFGYPSIIILARTTPYTASPFSRLELTSELLFAFSMPVTVAFAPGPDATL